VPIPDHACFTPSDLVEIAGELGFAADAHDDLAEAINAIPPGSRILIFGSLYLAGVVLEVNGQIPD
jgi:dihydrofolate synthase/folylpolyglutamate synthase